MSRPEAGSVVLVDWRRDARSGEPGKLRPAVVVEDDRAFPEDYPTSIVVPLTSDERLAHGFFAERIEPTPENGAESTCWALSHHVTTVSLQRVRPTASRIDADQLARIRERIVWAIGVRSA